MTDTYRLFVELPNGAKFRAHGEVDAVRVDAERFYNLLLSVPKPTIAASNGTTAPQTNSDDEDEPAPAISAGELPSESLSQQMIERLFAKDRTGTVSLRALPQGDGAESNALVALIYGSMMVGSEQQVTGSRLMKAAVQSGLQIDRIDRSLSSAIGPFVTTAGFKKGRRYGLTNPGIRRAEEILKAILN